MSGYSRSVTPFENPNALEESYQPDEIQGRSDETHEVQRVFQPVIDNEPPRNAFLYGLSGLGKTATTQYELNQLAASAEEYNDIRLTTIRQNCNDLNSSYQVAITLANQILPPNSQLPRSGLPAGQIYETLFEQINQLGTAADDIRDYVIIVLDEFDNIGSSDRLLYQIPQARANDRLNNVWPCLIGISNDITFRENLSPKVQSSLCEREITFSAYDADELSAILTHRSQIAFKEGAVDTEVLNLAAAYGAQEGGDARYSIDLLRSAGEIAKAEGRETVERHDLEEARDDVERNRVSETLSSMGIHEHLAAAALLYLKYEGETPVVRADLYPVYRKFAEEILGDSNNMRRLHSHLGDLDMLGLISRSRIITPEGRKFEYRIDSLRASLLLESLQSLEVPAVPSDSSLIPSDLHELIIDEG
ncbi:AAA family ATPase [Halococcus sediminicola]|uniref:AAA family ATPase n=1 Tax=Halococcus sediminicola TaxID=1264579 RepID=UPI0006799F04|nr:AAA family ATPase [Halococcus sediminicola]